METRASHILVGSFVLLFLVGAVAIALWVAKADLDAEYEEYDVYFDSSISGLLKNSTVYYMGIPVGDVIDLGLGADNPQQVRVTVRIEKRVPINEGASARLEFQGLTGVAFVELDGGPANAPPLEPPEGKENAVIPATQSALQALYTETPTLLDAAIKAVAQVQKLLRDENIQALSRAIQNTETLSANMARGTEDLEAVMSESRRTLMAVAGMAGRLEDAAGSADRLMKEDVTALVSDARRTMQTAETMLARVDGLVAGNEKAMTQFVNGSLPEISRMITDLRRTARGLSRLVKRVERNPSEVIFGGEEKTYDLKSRTVEEDEQ
ncbi:MlaD family protein [Yunchengibacter salinarum]|uniref:MlaD family protein n=1 Tax=Yunchengibacter salinarum TaxID=3133399 RepID=UPI0035B598A9